MGHYWGETVTLGPWVRVKVAKSNNPVFSTKWIAVSITFDGGDCHTREGIPSNGAKKLVVLLRNVFPRISIFGKAKIFMKVGSIPYGTVMWREIIVIL